MVIDRLPSLETFVMYIDAQLPKSAGSQDGRQTQSVGADGPNQGQMIEHLRERVRLLEAVIDNFPGGLLLFDQNLRLVLCNQQQQALLEYPESLFENGNPALEEIFRFNAQRGEYGPGSVEAHVDLKMALVSRKSAHVFERTRPNGTVLEIRGVPLESGGFVTTYLDVTEQRRNQSMIEHLAHHDAVTALPNRIKMTAHLRAALEDVANGKKLALHYIDLDRFKPINDTYGHDTGDAILQSVAGRLLDSVRNSDMVARIGGDEFIIIQTGIRSARDAELVGNRVIKAVSRSHVVKNRSYEVGVSIGVSIGPWDSENADELIRKADNAMYRSKKSGGNQICFYS
jgi:diguanylate cyclase (GGDEF)-like protein